MTQYELPDGFQGMETAPKTVCVNVIYNDGTLWNDIYPFPDEVIGWAPIVQLKKKVRFVVYEVDRVHGPYTVRDSVRNRCVADNLPTHESAQRIADIYNEVMP